MDATARDKWRNERAGRANRSGGNDTEQAAQYSAHTTNSTTASDSTAIDDDPFADLPDVPGYVAPAPSGDLTQPIVGPPDNFNLSELFQGADPLADLVAAFNRSLVQLDAGGLEEAIFIEAYAGPAGREFVARMLQLKQHQTPHATGRLLDMAKALSLFDFLKGFNIGAMGGGK